ncbi:MAG: hypothetical protein WCW13_05370 [archaeon]
MDSNKMTDFFTSLTNAIDKTDSGTFWPGGGGQIGSSFLKVDARDLHNQLQALKKNKTASEATTYFYNPSTIRYVAVGNFIIGLKMLIRDNIITLDSAKESLDFFFDILDQKVSTDPFCLNNKNIWFNKNQINQVLNEVNFKKVDLVEQTVVSRLVIALNSLVWSFYYDIYVESGFEFHGPYSVEYENNEYKLIIRDYHDLRPAALWEKANNFGYKSIKLYLLYSDVNIGIDYFMHEFSDKPLRTNLAFCAVETVDTAGNTKFFPINEVTPIAESAEEIAFEQVNYVNQLETIEKINMGARICYYQLKSFRDALGINWEPPQEVFDLIKQKGLERWEKFKSRAEKISAGVAKIDWGSKYDLAKPI